MTELKAALRAVAWPFLASRVTVLALLVVFGNLELVRMQFVFVKETRIRLATAPLTDVFSAGDAKWFRIIAEEGYVRAPFQKGMQVNWAFFPLFPLTTRYLRVFPSYAVNATVLTHLCFLGALLVLYALAREAGCDDRVARNAIGYAAFFPSAYFFSIPTSEALFVLLAGGCCVAAARHHWLLAGILGAGASATRVQGILLVAFLAVLWWKQGRRWRDVVGIALVPAGLVAFCGFLWRITGNPFAFADIQGEWQRSTGFSFSQFTTFWRDLPVISAEWNFRLLNVAMLLLLVAAFGILATKGQHALAAYVAASVGVVLLSGSLQSISRYVLSTFPVFIALASVGWSDRTHQIAQSASAIMLGALTVLYALHYDLAMA